MITWKFNLFYSNIMRVQMPNYCSRIFSSAGEEVRFDHRCHRKLADDNVPGVRLEMSKQITMQTRPGGKFLIINTSFRGLFPQVTTSVADTHRQISNERSLPFTPIFMQFLGKIGQIIGCPPPLGKSWSIAILESSAQFLVHWILFFFLCLH